MPAAASAPQLAKLRSNGHASELYCAFRVPSVIYSARLNGVPVSNDMAAEITYDGGSGTLANVKVDMTMYVGTSAGAYDLGYCRIRKAPGASTFYIGEQSVIVWQDNCYLTVVDDYDLWAKHIHIDGTDIKMDYDVTFSDQHSSFLPVPVLGPHRVAKLTGASVVVQLGPESGMSSWVHGSTISSYAWVIPSAVSISNSAIASPTATFNAVGWHACYCTVTSAAGKSKEGVRYVYIWDDDNLPSTDVKLGDADEDYQEGGFSLSIEMMANAGTDLIHDRALCIIFSQDYYGSGDDQVLGSVGHVAGAENIIAIGRIESESIAYNALAGKVAFRIAGYQQFFKRIKGFPSGLRMSQTPTTWVDMPALTVNRALWSFMEWRCTATKIMDITVTDNTLYAKELSSPSTSLWSQMEEFSFATILANIHVDMLGRFYAEVDPLLIPVADRDYPTIMTITGDDYIDEIELTRETMTRTGQVNLSGVNITDAGEGSAYFALSPGHIFARYGEIDIIDRLLVSGQTQANKLAGLIFAAKNNEYPRLRIKLRGNNRLIGCFPNQAVNFTISASDSPRGVAITKSWIPRRRKLSFDNAEGVIGVELELEAITDADAESIAVNGDIPGSDTDFSYPPLPSLPSLPSTLPILPGTPALDPAGPKYVLVHDNVSAGLVFTATFNQTTPVWYQVNSGLTSTQYLNINRVVVCPNGALYVAFIGIDPDVFVARAPTIGGTFEIIADATTIAVDYPTGNPAIYALNCNKSLSEAVAFIAGGRGYEEADAWYGVDGEFEKKAHLSNILGSGSISFGLDQWLLTYQGWSSGPVASFRLLSNDCSSILSTTVLGNYRKNKHVRLSATGTTYHYQDEAAGTLKVGTDNLDSNVDVGADLYPDENYDDGVAVESSGNFMLCSYSSTFKGKSSDGGSSWSDISGLAYVGNIWHFAYAGGLGTASRWVAGSSYIQYSSDFGISWTTKQGNLNSISPLYALDVIKVIGF